MFDNNYCICTSTDGGKLFRWIPYPTSWIVTNRTQRVSQSCSATVEWGEQSMKSNTKMVTSLGPRVSVEKCVPISVSNACNPLAENLRVLRVTCVQNRWRASGDVPMMGLIHWPCVDLRPSYTSICGGLSQGRLMWVYFFSIPMDIRLRWRRTDEGQMCRRMSTCVKCRRVVMLNICWLPARSMWLDVEVPWCMLNPKYIGASAVNDPHNFAVDSMRI